VERVPDGGLTMRQLLQQAPFLQQAPPIVVDVVKQPEPTRDIAIDVILGMFAMAGVLLAAAAIGSVLVAGGMILYRRWRDSSDPDMGQHTHTKLRI
jgi:hypothetical protein